MAAAAAAEALPSREEEARIRMVGEEVVAAAIEVGAAVGMAAVDSN